MKEFEIFLADRESKIYSMTRRIAVHPELSNLEETLGQRVQFVGHVGGDRTILFEATAA